MPLSTALPILKTDIQSAFEEARDGIDPPSGKTKEQILSEAIGDAVNTYVTSALLTVPGAGLLDSSSGPVAGSSITGTLS